MQKKTNKQTNKQTKNDILYFLQIVFIDSAARTGDLAKKFGFQKEDVITLKDNRYNVVLNDFAIQGKGVTFLGKRRDSLLSQGS